MALSEGQVGPYTVERELGRGGMGVVYLATDTRLGRSVALKALPPAFARDGDRLARFQREARTLAALNHPNVASIFGVEDAADGRFLVLEYVEGETLADRLKRGPLPVEEAMLVCEQIAAGIEAAHEAGIIHRDLKPGNVKITPDGKAKVLDFGISKGIEGHASGSQLSLSDSPTVTVPVNPVTAAGMVMGTAGYMSPEQARGKTVDKRTDIWSLGCVLFECLTGKLAFGGETVSDSIAAILEREPAWSELPARTPARVRTLLTRCLTKDARERLRDAGEARIELANSLAAREWTTGATRAAARTGSFAGRRRVAMGLLVLALPLAGALVASVTPLGSWLGKQGSSGAGAPSAVREATRLTVEFPSVPIEGWDYSLAPDGRALAFVARLKEGDRGQVYMRRLNDFELRPVQDTVGATGVTFSPDGEWLAFTTGSNEGGAMPMIRKVSSRGGPAVTLYEAGGERVRSLKWLDNETIAFAGPRRQQISFVSAQGGDAKVVVDVRSAGLETEVAGIAPLPGTESFLFDLPVVDSKGYRDRIWIASRRTGETRLLVDYGAYPRFHPGGTLFFSRGSTLLAAPFDRQKGEVTGPAVAVMGGLRAMPGYSSAWFSVSPSGALAYVPGENAGAGRRLARVDRQGKVEPLGTVRADFEGSIDVSPDGTKICGQVIGAARLYVLYVYDLAEGRLRDLPVPGLDCGDPVWMPDGRRVIFPLMTSGRRPSIMRRLADGSDSPELLFDGEKEGMIIRPVSPSADGSIVLCNRDGPNGLDIVGLNVAGGTVEPVVTTAADERSARFSPDGRWIAYRSDEAGRPEVYVRANPLGVAAPAETGRWTISARGGIGPRWSRDGSEIFFFEPPNRWMSAKVIPGDRFSTAPAVCLFTTDRLNSITDLEVMPDGNFAFVQMGEEESRVSRVNLVENWVGELDAKKAETGR